MAKKFAWSYSALTGYENCPYQHYRLKVKKDISEAPSQAMQWGSWCHTKLEDRLNGKYDLPESLEFCEPLCQRFDNAAKNGAEVLVEEKVCLTENLEPTEFFARNAWVRGVYDVCALQGSTAKIYDWKTGKHKVDHDQLALFAAIGFQIFDVDTIDTYLIWIKDKRIDKKTFEAEKQHLLWQDFLPRVEEMAESYEKDRFPCRPSGLCRGWCPVKDCKHYEAK